jgi:ABC-type transporter MlaC component
MVRTSNDADPAVRSLGRGFHSRRSWLGRFAWRTLGGGTLVLLLGAPLSPILAQSVSPTPPSAAPSTTAAPAKLTSAKTVAKKPDPAPPAKKIAKDATKAKSQDKQLAAAPKKHEEPKKLAATPKKPEAKQIADAAPKNPSLPSYTITTTHNHVTYTTTRVVPLQATPAPATKVAAVVPVSLTQPQPVEHLAAPVEKQAAAPAIETTTLPAGATPAPVTKVAAVVPVSPTQPQPVEKPAAAPAIATPTLPAASAPAPVTAAAVVVPVSLTQPQPVEHVVAQPEKPAAAPPTAPATQPAAAAPAPVTPAPVTKIAAVPVSPAQPVEHLAAPVRKPATAPPAAAAWQPTDSTPAGSFVANFLNDAVHIARSEGTTSLQRRAQLADLFAGKMDMKLIAGYTTADELTEMSPDLQQRFRTILISYLVETYYPRLELASDPSVTVDTTPAAPLSDGTAVVWTTFAKQGWGAQSVKWRLAAEKDGFKIVDIYSAGASLVQMERDTFLSVMRNGGVPELMAKLDQRTKALASAATE